MFAMSVGIICLKKKLEGRGSRPWGWVPAGIKTTTCDYCGRDGYKNEDVERERG